MENSGKERREFFRINDTVIIEYNVIEQNQIDNYATRITSPTGSDLYQDDMQLRVMQTNLNQLIETINTTDRDTARALRILDDKINQISLNMQRQINPINKDKVIHANVSGGGISFLADDYIEAKQTLNLYIQLLPSGITINALANVVVAEPQTEDKFLLRLVFTHMHEQDRNLLVKHTLNRQAEELRSNRVDSAMTLTEL